MRYFTSSGYRYGPHPLSYLVVALVGALIGGVLVLTLAPGYIATRAGVLGDAGGGGTAPPDGPAGTTPSPPVTWAGDWPVVAVAETVGPSVVGVIRQTVYYDWFAGKRTQESGGSGVIFKQADGYSYIGTNQHVTTGSDKLYVVLSDGRRLEAELVGEDWWTDLAVIRVKDTSMPVAVLGDSDRLRPGELVIAIGNPIGMEFQRSVTVGVVSGLDRTLTYGDEREFQLIQTDAAINPGNSGGPLVNASGEVVGINNMKIASQTVEAMGFAIPVNTARRVFDDLVAHGRVIRPFLGVRTVSAADARRYLQVDVDQGLYVVEVLPGTPAARCGMLDGDVILRLDGEATDSLADLRRALDRNRPGDEVEIEVLRRGRTLTLKAVLAEAPAGG